MHGSPGMDRKESQRGCGTGPECAPIQGPIADPDVERLEAAQVQVDPPVVDAHRRVVCGRISGSRRASRLGQGIPISAATVAPAPAIRARSGRSRGLPAHRPHGRRPPRACRPPRRRRSLDGRRERAERKRPRLTGLRSHDATARQPCPPRRRSPARRRAACPARRKRRRPRRPSRRRRRRTPRGRGACRHRRRRAARPGLGTGARGTRRRSAPHLRPTGRSPRRCPRPRGRPGRVSTNRIDSATHPVAPRACSDHSSIRRAAPTCPASISAAACPSTSPGVWAGDSVANGLRRAACRSRST